MRLRQVGAFVFALLAACVEPLPQAAPPQPSSGLALAHTEVEIRGRNFDAATRVAFGDNPATLLSVEPTRLRAVAPPHRSGAVHVEIATESGTVTLPEAFVYSAWEPIAPPPTARSGFIAEWDGSDLWMVDGDGHFFRSSNLGASWTAVTNQPLGVIDFAIAHHDSGSVLYAFTRHSESYSIALDALYAGWAPVFEDGDVVAVGVDPAERGVAYAGGYFSRIGSRGRDGVWSYQSLPDPTLTTTRFAFRPKAAGREVIASARDDNLNPRLFSQLAGETTWSPINLPRGTVVGLLRDLAAAEGSLVLLDDQGMVRRGDGSDQWTRIPEPPRFVHALAVDPEVPATLYATGVGIAKSTDSGQTWTELTPPEPDDASPFFVVEPPGGARLILMAGDGRLWRSLTGGE